jgi:uncharacterized SAM-binding protein YcdF (DUF218 family)
MLLILSKVLPTLLFPVGLVFFLCLLTSWFAFRKGARLAGLLALVAAVLLYTAANPRISNRLLLRLESQYPPSLENPKAAAIVLLGGGMAPMSAPRVYPETNAAGDRLLHAARLWKQGRAPLVVATGGYISFLTNATGSEAEIYVKALRDLFDLPDSALRSVPGTTTTADDAVRTDALFSAQGIQKEILLVTSASHMPRAVATFRKRGFIVHPAPTDYLSEEGTPFKAFQILPTAGALNATGVALHEYLGLGAYRLFGKL